MNKCPVCSSTIDHDPILIYDWLNGLSKPLKLKLMNSNIFTVYQLDRMTDRELLKYRNIGPFTLRKIRAALAKFHHDYPRFANTTTPQEAA